MLNLAGVFLLVVNFNYFIMLLCRRVTQTYVNHQTWPVGSHLTSAYPNSKIKEMDVYAEAALSLANFMHKARCRFSSFRMLLTLVPNFLFFTSLATLAKTS
jgi:hypothetical protein